MRLIRSIMLIVSYIYIGLVLKQTGPTTPYKKSEMVWEGLARRISSGLRSPVFETPHPHPSHPSQPNQTGKKRGRIKAGNRA